jgi:alanine dehydrogenase
MDVGIPNEQNPTEHRVGLTPAGTRLLTQMGHRCHVERGAGLGAGFPDESYENAGARIVYATNEVYERSDLVLKVGSPTKNEIDMLREGQAICAFWHLAARPREVADALLEKRVTTIAYETIERKDGTLPVLAPLSEIAGRMAPQIAARWLQNDGGGSGVLISGVPGVPPVNVTIVGAGVVGFNATWSFLRMGACISVLDISLEKLQRIDERFEGSVTTMVSYDFNIARAVQRSTIVIGAVLAPGERSPMLVTREMVRSMRPRSVILDISIDEGGCVETSRPMTHDDPVFIEEEVIHYCVPNMPGVVARTATHAYLNAAWPYIQLLANNGAGAAIEMNEDIARGVPIHNGEMRSPRLAALIGRE